LMKTFHAGHAQGRHPADALRTAQIERIRSRDADLQSPAAWAAFRYVGR
jgi:CHAT domain-containing protein